VHDQGGRWEGLNAAEDDVSPRAQRAKSLGGMSRVEKYIPADCAGLDVLWQPIIAHGA
jgi:hypothetical protein